MQFHIGNKKKITACLHFYVTETGLDSKNIFNQIFCVCVC